MEEKKEANDHKMKHFAKLHQRIQSKYDEMQKRIERSKSMDTLSNIKDDFNYKEQMYNSHDELRQSNGYDNTENVRNSLTRSVIVEEVTTRNASSQDLYRETSVSESVEEFMIIGKEDIDESNEYNKIFSSEFSKNSIESLNEVSPDSDSCSTSVPSTPPPKISFRDRINSKISARRERKKAENATKDKKKETRKVEKLFLSNTTKQDIMKSFRKSKVATVSIALIEASGSEVQVSKEKPRFMMCRFRLGTEKYKSKLIKNHKDVVIWQELFNLNMFEENMLEITLWDKDFFIGRSTIDLLEMKKEKTHQLHLDLQCDTANAQLFILLTITGTEMENTLVDLDDYETTQRRLSTVRKEFAWYHLENKSGDVGCFSIIVYGAKGLPANECYCIVEVGNERLHTHTDSKTNDPNWMKIFTFTVKDITSILEVTVHDEKKSEDIGKVSIPLLNIENSAKKWYALKDITQRDRAKGNNPRILLEMKVTWNPLRASMRVISPKEKKYLQLDDKLQRHIFARNLSRAKAVLQWIMDAFRIVKTCFEWESRRSNVIALTAWLLFCYSFRMWMLPLLLLIPFVRYRPKNYYLVYWWKYYNDKTSLEIEEHKKDKEEKQTSLRQKLTSIQEMVQSVQNFIGKIASLGESVKNLYNFTVPFLSFLAIFMISVVALVMYLIPVHFIFMAWGIHKFTRKILRPNRIPNNEILDLLSRVPDDETLLNIQELPLEELPEDVIK